ncbi:hypothetical protein [Runella slithyformis]|uniref:Uncharacterized protein n=1 Tax=Runella slithyformis (strain ATCC 29530 / DSM 19594 / LMG 11500 / NCIMB 11436 / LSU 4) TaxID=761193 RepID=A0A7U4E4C4_RUNSL|nr:hypothetical protein [Runella slithyformis]AEI47366.1 hypothetical protein Runsl_0929 [Runella slithyformis DSM 19594]
MNKTEFESLDCKLFEPISYSVLKQIRGGDSTHTPMPTYNTKCKCNIDDGYTTQDPSKKKKRPNIA